MFCKLKHEIPGEAVNIRLIAWINALICSHNILHCSHNLVKCMKISVRELKNHLSEYLRRVEAGEEVVVTSHKRVVAKLVPPNTVGEEYGVTEEVLIERLKSLPWVRWSGGKPQRRRGVAVKQGGKTLSESILDDRR